MRLPSDKALPVPFGGHPGGFPASDLFYELSDAEEQLNITHADLQWQWPWHSIMRYGADPTGKRPSTEAVQTAYNVAGEAVTLDTSLILTNWITEQAYQCVTAPAGAFMIDSNIAGRDRVSFIGQGQDATIVFASEGFPASMMFNYDEGVTPLFGCGFRKCRLHASNRSIITRVIRAKSWQEHCGLVDAEISGYQGVGIEVSDGSSGASGFQILRTGFTGFAGNDAAIEVQATVPNAFLMTVRDVTINPSGAVATAGISMLNGILVASAVHVENCTDAIKFEGAADGFLSGITGNGSVVNVVGIDSAHTGSVRGFIIDPNGATGNTLNYEGAGTDLTGFQAEIAVN